MELIDRRKLVSDFWKGVEDCSILSYEDTDSLMENAPTVDAVEVVHGRWLTLEEYAEKIGADHTGYPGGWSFCSVCEQQMRTIYGWNYCPNCGAKMDGDGNG